ncbi:hypothetical protein DVJ83_15150 (plasmid) [Deinococcus wulumuqiensis]|uniref:Uncharacterized protein n=1 Tax=Deinococcus wulumuqiensis TaxID=980427 RepID=A0A345ILE3_9DEIO|nr:hypothetical protein DVJ83_15150 [Deinococcus wulumuqiensis]
MRGAHGKNTVLRRWASIRRLSGCSGIGLKPYDRLNFWLSRTATTGGSLPAMSSGCKPFHRCIA